MDHSDSENSDTSDEDYNPDDKAEEVVSADESDGDCEEDEVDPENIDHKGKRRKSGATKGNKRLKQALSGQESVADETDINSNSDEDRKKEEDALWESFRVDTGFVSKSNKTTSPAQKPTPSKKTDQSTEKPQTTKKTEEKIKVTEIFEFAGEEVIVEKEVDAKTALKVGTQSKSGGGGGLGNILKNLGKKNKISTLEKTKLDWDRFKKEEKLEDELKTHNKGKDGYLERQDFLERADHRRFEIEKSLRSINRSKRLN